MYQRRLEVVKRFALAEGAISRIFLHQKERKGGGREGKNNRKRQRERERERDRQAGRQTDRIDEDEVSFLFFSFDCFQS